MSTAAEHAKVAQDTAPYESKRIANAIIERFQIPAEHALRAASVLAIDDRQWAFKISQGYWIDPVLQAIEATRYE
ncbi:MULTISPECIES: hypothetical protein [Mycobacteriaceae]|uniref:Uncharacterized protein n=1 Tax=Mycolicibacterium lutetiense TaxID=1641992 RepID=A0ABS4ZQT0_9MYCO|nr:MULTISPECIES: hypothetical protein [Mycobacteriaceae]MBP2451795.1 hypothetical protein [Mycolicibacterium lutetiense]OLT97696.1 hypothetical protein BKG60_04835 [Mycobacterium syngnathidarum]